MLRLGTVDPMNRPPESGPVVLYSDFNCPFCYAMHERLHAHGVSDRIEWRGVQHAPHLPVPMARWNGDLMEELRHEVEMVGRLAPGLPIALPEGKPNTRPAIQLAARALAADASRGAALIDRLYRLFWCEGEDISDATVLADAVLALGLRQDQLAGNEGQIEGKLQNWNDHWHRTGQAGVPLLERTDGMLLVGLAREGDLRRFLSLS